MSAQTAYNLDMSEQIAGQIVERGRVSGKFSLSADAEPGRLHELSSGQLRIPSATTLGAVIGALPYMAGLRPQTDGTDNLWRANEYPPMQRTGQVWLKYSGTAPTVGAAVNVMHSSTTATHRGKVTGSATDVTAGTEISAVEGLRCMEVDTTNSLALVELNLPA